MEEKESYQEALCGDECQYQQQHGRLLRQGSVPNAPPESADVPHNGPHYERRLVENVPPEFPVIALANACPEPHAMVVEPQHTFVAVVTVLGPQRLPVPAIRAPPGVPIRQRRAIGGSHQVTTIRHTGRLPLHIRGVHQQRARLRDRFMPPLAILPENS
jgi:hypothetical protein